MTFKRERCLADVAIDVMAKLDDMAEDEYERVKDMPPADRVRYLYLCGDCDYFAVALHRMTGWPIRGATASVGFLHRFVEAPDGRFLDSSGWTSIEIFRQRYNTQKIRLTAPGGEEMAIGFYADVVDGIDEGLRDAVIAVRELPWPPFDDLEFSKMSSVPVAGIDCEIDGALPKP